LAKSTNLVKVVKCCQTCYFG